MNKYGPEAQRMIHKVMREFEEGAPGSGLRGTGVAYRNQTTAGNTPKAGTSVVRAPKNSR